VVKTTAPEYRLSSVMHEDVNRADTMLAQLSDLLRRTLRAAHSQEVPLEEELALLRSYLAIMEERFGEDLTVRFAVDLALSEALVPQLILQPHLTQRRDEAPK
jgi:two-component system, LytTR family, sensor kinase